MQLADAASRLVPSDGTADDRTWEAAVSDVRGNTGGGLERFYGSLPAGNQKTHRAIASSGSIYGTAASFVDLSPGTACDSAHALAGDGILRRSGSRFKMIDPLQSHWLRQRFTTPL